jgi:hypothetical protein
MRSDDIIGAVESVTRKWTKQRKKEERESSAELNRRWMMTRSSHTTVKEAAWQVMERAYLKASADGTLPAHARQVMYAARGHIQRTADRDLGKRFDQYFTQQLLPEYVEEHGCSDWNVVYDARGHFHEPHTNEEVPLGTLQVRDYLSHSRGHSVGPLEFDIWESRYPTRGPRNAFGAILFIEKEGFMPLFRAVKLAERFDLAIMSTKGMSVTASRELVDELCTSVPLLVLHDFDKAGFSIVGTLHRDTRRYAFRNPIDVIDLGLRLGDIDGLESENVHIPSPDAARANLRQNGATPKEIEFLLERRVELNAFSSDALIEWIERKLDEHGVAKVIPDKTILADAYCRAREQAAVQERVDEALEAVVGECCEDFAIPPDLEERVKRETRERPYLRWDAIVRDLAVDDHGETE